MKIDSISRNSGPSGPQTDGNLKVAWIKLDRIKMFQLWASEITQLLIQFLFFRLKSFLIFIIQFMFQMFIFNILHSYQEKKCEKKKKDGRRHSLSTSLNRLFNSWIVLEKYHLIHRVSSIKHMHQIHVQMYFVYKYMYNVIHPTFPKTPHHVN